MGEFYSETPRVWEFFGDFSSYAKQSGVSFIYYDQEIQGLFFAVPSGSAGGGAEVNVFYYNKVF